MHVLEFQMEIETHILALAYALSSQYRVLLLET